MKKLQERSCSDYDNYSQDCIMYKIINVSLYLLSVFFVAVLCCSEFITVSLADITINGAESFFNAMSAEQFADPDALDDFIRRFPDSEQARMAFAYRYSLLEKNPTIEGYNEFIAKYPDKLQAQIAIQEVFKLYRRQDRVTGYYDFIQRYSDTQQAVVAMMRIQELMFEYVCKLDKEEEYDAFISAFPDAPQVKNALEKAKQKALEKEKTGFEKFQNGEPKPDENAVLKYIFDRISAWEEKVDDFLSDYPSIDISDNTTSDERIEIWNQLYKIDREAFVLRRVYGGYDRAGRIQSTRNSLEIIKRLDKINQTLETNHKELLSKLDEDTEKICKGLEQLHLDNQLISKKIQDGFSELHNDMLVLHHDNVDIKETLDKMDSHLEAINRSVVEGFKKIDETLKQKFTKNNNKVITGFKILEQFLPKRHAGLRIQPGMQTELSFVAEVGYNKSNRLWNSRRAAEQIARMNSRFSAASSDSTMIAKLIGGLAGLASSFIPYIGPFIAPAVTDVVTSEIIDVNAKNELLDKAKQRILFVANEFSDNEISPHNKELIMSADSFESLDKAIDTIANDCNTSQEALKYAAQYIY